MADGVERDLVEEPVMASSIEEMPDIGGDQIGASATWSAQQLPQTSPGSPTIIPRSAPSAITCAVSGARSRSTSLSMSSTTSGQRWRRSS
jgi:hypothetical protein